MAARWAKGHYAGGGVSVVRSASDVGLVSLATFVTAQVGLCWWGRIDYPFDLEWMEGGMLAHAWRLQQGLPLYAAPTADWIPYVYPPGYPALLALLGLPVGLTPLLGRAVSILGSLMAAGSVAAVCLSAGVRAPIAVGAAASFLATYEAGGAFFDLVRPDGLFLGLCGLAIAAALRPGWAAAAGVALALGILLKHNAAGWLPVLALGVGLRDGRRAALTFLIAACALPAVVFGALQWTTDGHLLRYLVEVPASHPLVAGRGLPGVAGELAHAMPVALAVVGLWSWLRASWGGRGVALVVAAVAGGGASWMEPGGGVGSVAETAVGAAVFAGVVVTWGWRRPAWPSPAVVIGVGVGAIAVGLAAWMRAHHGGFLNVLIPMYWAFCCALGVAADRLGRRWRWADAFLACGLVGAQILFSASSSDWARLIPTRMDREAGERWIEVLRNCDGPVFSPYAAWLPTYAGHAPEAHLIALWDIDHARGPYKADVAKFHLAAKNHRWACVVDSNGKGVGFGIPQAYRRETTVVRSGGVFVPKTGWRVQPEALWVPSGTSGAPSQAPRGAAATEASQPLGEGEGAEPSDKGGARSP